MEAAIMARMLPHPGSGIENIKQERPHREVCLGIPRLDINPSL